MDLILLPLNKKKVYESKLMPFFYNINNVVKTEIIHFKKGLNINKELLHLYKNKPDLFIIDFNEKYLINNITFIKNKPIYPIISGSILYITPICIEQINGFSNKLFDKESILEDAIERIMYGLGGILVNNRKISITHKNNKAIFNNGIKDYLKNFRKDSNVSYIPEWMTNGIDKNKTGWFTIENSLAIDYVLDTYKDTITNIAELGSYFGKSTKYIASKKKDNVNLFAFDDFKNVLLTDYTIDNPNPLDYKYFLQYLKFEGFHKNLAGYNNIYSIKCDCYTAPKWLKKNNIKIDLFYLDFCKVDHKLIKIVDEIFELFPESIIIGDDAKWLDKALTYFKEKYNYIYAYNCYICSYKKNLINKDSFIKKVKDNQDKEKCLSVNKCSKLNLQYRIKYLLNTFNKNTFNKNTFNKNTFNKNTNSDNFIKNINEQIKELSINPNERCRYIVQGGCLFHQIAIKYREDIKNRNKWLSLYQEIIKKYKDKSIKNYLGLTPNDYFNYNLIIFK
jgi:hypothetical protein